MKLSDVTPPCKLIIKSAPENRKHMIGNTYNVTLCNGFFDLALDNDATGGENIGPLEAEKITVIFLYPHPLL